MHCQATGSVSVTQSDPIGAIASLPPPTSATAAMACPAQRLGPRSRQDRALGVRAGTATVSQLARRHEVSRKFVYQQADLAEAALGQAFDPTPTAKDVLFYLPVTKAWLRQLV